jgi:hypothetical protein
MKKLLILVAFASFALVSAQSILAPNYNTETDVQRYSRVLAEVNQKEVNQANDLVAYNMEYAEKVNLVNRDIYIRKQTSLERYKSDQIEIQRKVDMDISNKYKQDSIEAKNISDVVAKNKETPVVTKDNPIQSDLDEEADFALQQKYLNSENGIKTMNLYKSYIDKAYRCSAELEGQANRSFIGYNIFGKAVYRPTRIQMTAIKKYSEELKYDKEMLESFGAFHLYETDISLLITLNENLPSSYAKKLSSVRESYNVLNNNYEFNE